uniref:SH3 domain-containing protein n=1 Tax=Timema poppense TaxID=170557 RepID=A0A7R9HHU8_TIMPO|nr:unnamed protein product [Timema poppensis]
MIRPKVVVALYPFKAIEGGDLSLEKGAEYEVLDDSQEHWWKVKDEQGSVSTFDDSFNFGDKTHTLKITCYKQ